MSRDDVSLPTTNYNQICMFLGDYRNMTGEGIPFRKLGFDSLGSLLDSLPESLVVRRLPTGGMIVGLRHDHQDHQVTEFC